jgi:hypothetical protein
MWLTEMTSTRPGFRLSHETKSGISTWQCLQVEDQKTMSRGFVPDGFPEKVTVSPVSNFRAVKAGGQCPKSSLAG